MTKRKTSIFSIVYTVALLIMVLGILSTISHPSGNIGSNQNQKETTLALMYKGNILNPSTIPLSSDSAINIIVEQADKTKSVSVRIYAIADEGKDFSFRVDEKSYSWNNEIAGLDMTETFGLTVTQATKKTNAQIVLKGTVVDVLETIFDGQSVDISEIPTQNLFRMEVHSGELMKSVSLYQGEYKATRLEISDFNIIF